MQHRCYMGRLLRANKHRKAPYGSTMLRSALRSMALMTRAPRKADELQLFRLLPFPSMLSPAQLLSFPSPLSPAKFLPFPSLFSLAWPFSFLNLLFLPQPFSFPSLSSLFFCFFLEVWKEVLRISVKEKGETKKT